MLTQTMSREGIDISPILKASAVSGVALVLGYSPEAVELLLANPKVRWVIAASQTWRGHYPRARFTHFPVDPAKAQRRDVLSHPCLAGTGVARDQVDYLFSDLSNEPWDLARIDAVRGRVKEFRPRAVGYRWQELDIVANHVATGGKMDLVPVKAFDAYHMETGIPVQPRTAEYGLRCAAMTANYFGKAR